MMNWEEEYNKKLVPAEEAAKVVRSGDRVVFTTGREPLALGLAIAARKEELRDVEIESTTPARDFGWYDPGWEDSFKIVVGYVFPRGVGREALDEKRLDLSIGSAFYGRMGEDDRRIDVLLVEVSPPDKHGYCSFGASVWNKREQVQRARTVLAEVNEHLIRTYGDNYVHVSEIDYFVEHMSSGRRPGTVDMTGKSLDEVDENKKQIAKNVASLIKDGDTIQIGVGSASELLPRLGLLDNRVDLGWHSEVTPSGIIKLVREGVVTGKRKTLDRGKCVASAIGGGTVEEMEFVNENPLFELRSSIYVNDIQTIAAQENMVAINNAIAVDLGGQIASESIGRRMWSGAAGGQPAFCIGATLAKGGRSVIVLPSTAQGGKVSRIVPEFEQGTIVTIPRTLADHVVTEYGVAKLRGKTLKQRIEALIAIAHPDFREDLRNEARKIYYRYL